MTARTVRRIAALVLVLGIPAAMIGALASSVAKVRQAATRLQNV
ncbi:MAG: hypothetical protein U0744_12460 [Gemmataceae bacterium]